MLWVVFAYFVDSYPMTIFQLLVICTGAIFVLFAIDLYQRQKFNLLHFLVFFGGTAMIVVFSFKPALLQSVGSFFGVARGADIIVYVAIIFLAYLYFGIINQQTKYAYELTRIVTARAIQHTAEQLPSQPLPASSDPKDAYAFLVRAYNEATMIGAVIDEIVAGGFRKIVVCDDGSKDATRQIVLAKAAQYPEATIWCLSHAINRGPGAANKTLFAFAAQYADRLGVQRLVTFDADGQMSVADMSTFMRYADHTNYDVIIGSRFVEGARVDNMPLFRKIILIGGRVVTRVFNGLRITDVPTGYRMYHASIIGKIRLTSDRFSYQHEVIDSIAKHHLRFVEVPVHIRYTDYSLAKGQSNMSALKILKELIYKTFFFR